MRATSVTQRKQSCATFKLICLAVSKDEWSKHEDIGEECIVCTAVCQSTSRTEVTSNSEKLSPYSLSYASLKASGLK